MAKPNFHDRSWDEIDWEAWGPHFSIRDRATSIGELQNGITTRYIEVQNLLSRLPPHAGKAHNLVVMWRHEVNGFGRTIHFAESSRILKRLDELHGQVTMQAEAARQAAKVAKKQRQRALAAAVHKPAEAGAPEADGDLEGFEGPAHSAATARQRSDSPRPGQDTAEARWHGAQAVMARECDRRLVDTARPVTNKHFLSAIHAPEGVAVEQFQHAHGSSPIRIVVAGGLQFWTTGLPTLEQFGIARYAVYRRDGMADRFEHAAGNRRPEDLAAEREAVEGGPARKPGAPDPVA
jgi:hypothetical protein